MSCGELHESLLVISDQPRPRLRRLSQGRNGSALAIQPRDGSGFGPTSRTARTPSQLISMSRKPVATAFWSLLVASSAVMRSTWMMASRPTNTTGSRSGATEYKAQRNCRPGRPPSAWSLSMTVADWLREAPPRFLSTTTKSEKVGSKKRSWAVFRPTRPSMSAWTPAHQSATLSRPTLTQGRCEKLRSIWGRLNTPKTISR
jgi:hypothetical protein